MFDGRAATAGALPFSALLAYSLAIWRGAARAPGARKRALWRAECQVRVFIRTWPFDSCVGFARSQALVLAAEAAGVYRKRSRESSRSDTDSQATPLQSAA